MAPDVAEPELQELPAVSDARWLLARSCWESEYPPDRWRREQPDGWAVAEPAASGRRATLELPECWAAAPEKRTMAAAIPEAKADADRLVEVQPAAGRARPGRWTFVARAW